MILECNLLYLQANLFIDETFEIWYDCGIGYGRNGFYGMQ